MVRRLFAEGSPNDSFSIPEPLILKSKVRRCHSPSDSKALSTCTSDLVMSMLDHHANWRVYWGGRIPPRINL